MADRKYEVRVAPAAVRQIKKLPRSVQQRLVRCFESLSEQPRPSGVEKLSQNPRFWRVRVGDYRVIYWIDDEAAVIVTLIVRHRKDAYRNLDQLDPAIVAKSLKPFLTGLSVSNY
jgi:mRNA interferase RelE/StbE